MPFVHRLTFGGAFSPSHCLSTGLTHPLPRRFSSPRRHGLSWEFNSALMILRWMCVTGRYCECDIAVTNEKKLVLCHDNTFGRLGTYKMRTTPSYLPPPFSLSLDSTPRFISADVCFLHAYTDRWAACTMVCMFTNSNESRCCGCVEALGRSDPERLVSEPAPEAHIEGSRLSPRENNDGCSDPHQCSRGDSGC